jgi:3-hydroxyisobutyrate dehydrogenase
LKSDFSPLAKEILMPTSTPSTTTLAFLGIGQMGSPMATRLVEAGFKVRAWNRSPGPLKTLTDAGATGATSPAEAARDADVLVTMLPDGTAIEKVMTGPDGALASLHKGALWLQMSSVGVEWAEKLGALAKDAGVTYVDAPVSGSIVPAKDGTLIVLASGPDSSHDDADAVFKFLGKNTVWLGEAGAGSKAKLVLNNWLVDLVESTTEMLHFSQALGLDPRSIIDLLESAPIGSPYAVSKARLMLQGDFTPNFALKHALKDAYLSVQAAKSVDADLRLTESFIDSWQHAVDDGLGDQDLSVVYSSHHSAS